MGKIYLVVLLFVVSGCAGMETALSQMTQEMGSQCATYTVRSSVYMDGEYLVDKRYGFRDAEKDRKERRWIVRTRNYYLNFYKFDTWYETSPVSQHQYRFNVHCSRYY